MRKIAIPMLACLAAGCTMLPPPEPAPTPAPVEQAAPTPPPQPIVVRDPQLEQKLARTELLLIEKEAQVTELHQRLDDARREVVRAMAKSTQLATRAEAASGIAEAEIAVRNSGAQGAKEASGLMQQCTAEFDKENYAGALYLANQAKIAALATRGQGSVERNSLRDGETPFALPLRLQTTSRANVREGPGSNFTVSFTLPADSDLTGYSYTDQWVRISDANGRRGWIFQGLIGRKP